MEKINGIERVEKEKPEPMSIEDYKAQNEVLLAKVKTFESWSKLDSTEISILNHLRLGLQPNETLNDQTNDQNCDLHGRAAIDLMSIEEIQIYHRNLMRMTSLVQYELNKQKDKIEHKKKDKVDLEKATEYRSKAIEHPVNKKGPKKLSIEEKCIRDMIKGPLMSRPISELVKLAENILPYVDKVKLTTIVEDQYKYWKENSASQR